MGLNLYTENDVNRHAELSIKDGDVRSDFRRDYTRLLHSAVFRRLQGKTQLFPSVESDYFRNRLTHSLEVSQISKTLGMKLLREHNLEVDLDLLEFAGLAHDLGHPPFGHNGERALDDCMKKFGGFEGNAQTLRLLTASRNEELGLNVTYRSLAAILKYDKEIPRSRGDGAELVKGYYESEGGLVRYIKENVAPNFSGDFKTIECQIMDLADDIAYSTYDLEDALKAGFYSPIEMLAASDEMLTSVAGKVAKETGVELSNKEVWNVIFGVFSAVLRDEAERLGRVLLNELGVSENIDPSSIFEEGKGGQLSVDQSGAAMARLSAEIFKISRSVANEATKRTCLTSGLIDRFVNCIEGVDINENSPALSILRIRRETQIEIEVLKHFAYEALITSSRLKVVEYRGYDIVKSLFDALSDDGRKGYMLLPDDYRSEYQISDSDSKKKRVVCDFIAGMTDRYAVEYYCRLYDSESSASMFKPL